MPFQYKPRSQESYEARAKLDGSGGVVDPLLDGNYTYFHPEKEEIHEIRILPPAWPDPVHYGVPVYLHYNVGADRARYLCAALMLGKDCPVCDAHAAALRANKTDVAKRLQANRRCAFFLIDRKDESKGVQIWFAPVKTFDSVIKKLSPDPETGRSRFPDDPESGYDISFHYGVASWGGLSYTDIAFSRRPTPLHIDSAIKKQWLDFVLANPIPNILKHYPAERIASVFNGAPQTNYTPPTPPVAQKMPSDTPPIEPQTETPPPAPAPAAVAPAVKTHYWPDGTRKAGRLCDVPLAPETQTETEPQEPYAAVKLDSAYYAYLGNIDNALPVQSKPHVSAETNAKAQRRETLSSAELAEYYADIPY